MSWYNIFKKQKVDTSNYEEIPITYTDSRELDITTRNITDNEKKISPIKEIADLNNTNVFIIDTSMVNIGKFVDFSKNYSDNTSNNSNDSANFDEPELIITAIF